jgi:hypothetical protein
MLDEERRKPRSGREVLRQQSDRVYDTNGVLLGAGLNVTLQRIFLHGERETFRSRLSLAGGSVGIHCLILPIEP